MLTEWTPARIVPAPPPTTVNAEPATAVNVMSALGTPLPAVSVTTVWLLDCVVR